MARTWLTGFIWSTEGIFTRGKSRARVLNQLAFGCGGIFPRLNLRACRAYHVWWRRGETP